MARFLYQTIFALELVSVPAAHAVEFGSVKGVQVDPLMTYLQTSEDKSRFYAHSSDVEKIACERVNLEAMLTAARERYSQKQQQIKASNDARTEKRGSFFGKLFGSKKKDPEMGWNIASAAKDRKVQATVSSFQQARQAIVLRAVDWRA